MPILKPLPHRIVKPKPGRLSWRKKVTIAAGFECTDGIVLCSDSELTYSDWLRLQGSKMQVFAGTNLSGIMTGAGSWDYVLMALEKISMLIGTRLRNNVPVTWFDIQRIVEAVVLEIYSRHIHFYPSDPKPGFSLLLGIWSGQQPVLIRTDDTAVVHDHGFQAVGAGFILARHLADTLYSSDMSIREGYFLAIYILRLAKKYVPGCGGQTSILGIDAAGKTYGPYGLDITDLETHFAEFDKVLRPLLVSFPNTRLPDKDFKDALAQFNREIRQFRNKRKKLKLPPDLGFL